MHQQVSDLRLSESAAKIDHIAVLDGLRFIAAATVMVSHYKIYFFGWVAENSAYLVPLRAIEGLSNIGMTLFFVLSGFVIHYNYRTIASSGLKGAADFAIARIARLYPLFLVAMLWTLWTMIDGSGYPQGRVDNPQDIFGALPFYLTFTQSWFFVPFGDVPAWSFYNGAAGVMWSLSTEAAFYAVYPLLARPLSRLSGHWLIAAFVAVSAVGILYIKWVSDHWSIIREWATWRYPYGAADSFVPWLVGASPMGRMHEFLVGSLAAQMYLTRRLRLDAAHGLSIILAALLLTGYAWIHLAGSRYGGIGPSYAAPAIALLLLTTASGYLWLSKWLAYKPMVWGGEASYSLYLLHVPIALQFVIPWAYTHLGGPANWLAITMALAAALVVSRLSYLLFERPASRWVRRHFRPLRMGIWLPLVIAIFSIPCVISSIQVRALARTVPRLDGTITLSTASFDEPCAAAADLLQTLERACTRRKVCNVPLVTTGAPSCPNLTSVKVDYSCNPDLPPRQTSAPTNGAFITLSCR